MTIKFKLFGLDSGKNWEMNVVPRVGDYIYVGDILTDETERILMNQNKIVDYMKVEKVIWNNENGYDAFVQIELETE